MADAEALLDMTKSLGSLYPGEGGKVVNLWVLLYSYVSQFWILGQEGVVLLQLLDFWV